MIITAEVLGVARRHGDDEHLRDALVKRHENFVRKREAELRTQSSTSSLASVMPIVLLSQADRERPRRTKPWTDAEIEKHMLQYAAGLAARWNSCLDYLASVAWPALHFRLTNDARAFLKNVEIILTFHGAAGVRWVKPENFYLES
jgi:hypothetical protein